jgi:F-type H+-transporting ATPase subunit epsilon
MLKLEIVTPEKRVVNAEVDSVTVPTASGEAGIFPNHAPLISALKPGIITFSVKGASERLVVSGGFIEVSGEKVAVLADSAETANEIDPISAKTDREDVEKSFSSSGVVTEEDAQIALEARDLANARVALSSR